MNGEGKAISGWMSIDSFSSLDHLKSRDFRNDDVMLHALRLVGRVSSFELDERPELCRAILSLEKRGKIQLDNSVGYPWTAVKVLVDAPSVTG